MDFCLLIKKLRTKKLNEISKQNKTIILYEAPHKLLKRNIKRYLRKYRET